MYGQQLKGNLGLLLLSILERGPLHGYAVITELRERSGGAFTLAEGTVYPALHRLEKDGLVASAWSTGERRRRRVYRLTGAGATELHAKSRDWADFARGMGAVLRPALGGTA
jgi:PadR family transcriptional regulator PadR